jgi:hypothetical protein
LFLHWHHSPRSGERIAQAESVAQVADEEADEVFRVPAGSGTAHLLSQWQRQTLYADALYKIEARHF